MRVLVDAPFPHTLVGPVDGGAHRIDRYSDEAVSDPLLVRYARQHGYDILVFLGTGALAEDRVVQAATTAGMTVAATYEMEPGHAAELLKRRLGDLASASGHTALIIKADSVEPLVA